MPKDFDNLSVNHENRQGNLAYRVASFNHITNRTRDMFGVFDVISFRPDGQTVLIQTTSRGDMARRRRKIDDSPEAQRLIEWGYQVMVHGWDQPGGHGARWRLKAELLT